MPQPILPGLVNQSLAVAFRAVETILREDPVLARIVSTWRTMQGEPEDFNPPEDAELPWIRLTVDNSTLEHSWLGLDVMQFAILAEMAVEGTRAENILGLWQALKDALRMDKPFRGTTVREFMYPARRGADLKVSRPNFRPVRHPPPTEDAPPGPTNLACSCVISLTTTLQA